eukprot:TRINITY_DN6311_c0_g1_i1.p1 TRINITY_DN6311_c0_g1~~TRINITY_DN6311_c0_g1_i1.p1  ORF type:complete len:795 (+),score=105.05 TRINITY_DN6311_c0_g1_i1:82-2466(+)
MPTPSLSVQTPNEVEVKSSDAEPGDARSQVSAKYSLSCCIVPSQGAERVVRTQDLLIEPPAVQELAVVPEADGEDSTEVGVWCDAPGPDSETISGSCEKAGRSRGALHEIITLQLPEDEVLLHDAFRRQAKNVSTRSTVSPIIEGNEEDEDDEESDVRDVVLSVDGEVGERQRPIIEAIGSPRSRGHSRASSREGTPKSKNCDGTPKSQGPAIAHNAWNRCQHSGEAARNSPAWTSSGSGSLLAQALSQLGSTVFGSMSMSNSGRPTLNRLPTLASITQRRTLASMVSLSLSSPELLRATRAADPLKYFGRVLRDRQSTGKGFGRSQTLQPGMLQAQIEQMAVAYRKQQMDDYVLSFQTRHIDDFWSHSWRANSWLKVLVLLLYYNQAPAAICSCIAALLGMVATSFDWLPVMFDHNASSTTEVVEEFKLSAWCSILGLMTFCIVLVLWRPSDRVFLDKVCIHQKDPKRKKDGVESIGAFLLHSDTMLVLWDPSYATRLWCVFEMAAFAWAHRDYLQNRVQIRPIIFAPVYVGLVVTAVVSWWVILYLPKADHVALLAHPLIFSVCILLGMHSLRRFHRDMTILKHHLKKFKVANTECFCCTACHKDRDTGAKINCDREVIQACIVAWFGSLDEFDDFVQSELAQYFYHSLGRFGLPYRWVLGSQLPVLWAYMDVLAGRHFREGFWNWWQISAITVEGIAMWVGGSPLMIAFVIWVTHWLKRKRRYKFVECSFTLLAALLTLIPLLLLTVLWWASRFAVSPNPLIGAAVFLLVLAELTLVVFRWGRGDKKKCCL